MYVFSPTNMSVHWLTVQINSDRIFLRKGEKGLRSFSSLILTPFWLWITTNRFKLSTTQSRICIGPSHKRLHLQLNMYNYGTQSTSTDVGIVIWVTAYGSRHYIGQSCTDSARSCWQLDWDVWRYVKTSQRYLIQDYDVKPCFGYSQANSGVSFSWPSPGISVHPEVPITQ